MTIDFTPVMILVVIGVFLLDKILTVYFAPSIKKWAAKGFDIIKKKADKRIGF